MLELLLLEEGDTMMIYNDTETHLIFSTGANFSASTQIGWKVIASMLPAVALCFSSRRVFVCDKTSCFKSEFIVEFSWGTDFFASMWHA